MFGSNKEGTIAYIECKDSNESCSHFLFSTIFQNADQTTNGKSTVYMKYGSLFFNYMNFTNNHCKEDGLVRTQGSGDFWINSSYIVKNVDGGIPSELGQSTGFYEFIMMNNTAVSDNQQTIMFSMQFSVLLIQNFTIYDDHYITYYCINVTMGLYTGILKCTIYGEGMQTQVNDVLFGVYVEKNGISLGDGVKFGNPPNEPLSFELPDYNQCKLYNNPSNNYPIEKANITHDDRKGKHHVGLVALLGYSSMI